LFFNTTYPTGLLTSYLHPDVRRQGLATDYLVKDHLASNRLIIRHGGTSALTNYGPYGLPLTSNGSVVPDGKAYINERFDPDTGLMYLHARYMDPNSATENYLMSPSRFITKFGLGK
jgi:hypothetical protein